MVERVARGIVRARHRTCCEHRPLEDFPIGPFEIDVARAAIEAMREPTIDMFCAGDEEILRHLNDHRRLVEPEPTPAQSCWTAMIVAALSGSLSGTGERSSSETNPNIVGD